VVRLSLISQVFEYLERSSVSGKEFVASANWRGEEDVGMDRVLCDGRVVFD